MKRLFSIVYFLLCSPVVLSATLPLTAPSKDEFYQPAENYENAKLGEILKVRESPQLIQSFYYDFTLKKTWQIQYRSEDSFGNPTAIITTVLEPHNANPNKVLSYQTFEDSSNIDCSPSYGFLSNSPLSTIATKIDLVFMGPALESGYYVVSPDYEGPKSAFTVGGQAGKATLDGVRAILNSGNITGISQDADVLLHGYSGGSIASLWAASLQPSYAPELKDNLIGACVGGVVTNITATAEAIDGGLLTGLTPLALNGLANEYPEFDKILKEKVSPKYNQSFSDGDDHCLGASVFTYAFDDFFTNEEDQSDIFFPGGYDLLKIPYVNEVIQANCLLNLNESYVPQIPVFMYHGTLDDVVPIKDVRVVYKNWCDWGIDSLEFAEDLLNGHITEQFVGSPAAWTWMQKMFERSGEPVKGCSHTARLENILYPNISESTFDYYFKVNDILSVFSNGTDLSSLANVLLG